MRDPPDEQQVAVGEEDDFLRFVDFLDIFWEVFTIQMRDLVSL